MGWNRYQRETSSLNILIRYVESTVFREMWPEHLLTDKEQTIFGKLFYLILNLFNFKSFSRLRPI